MTANSLSWLAQAPSLLPHHERQTTSHGCGTQCVMNQLIFAFVITDPEFIVHAPSQHSRQVFRVTKGTNCTMSSNITHLQHVKIVIWLSTALDQCVLTFELCQRRRASLASCACCNVFCVKFEQAMHSSGLSVVELDRTWVLSTPTESQSPLGPDHLWLIMTTCS